MLVGKDDVSMESLHHEQSLAECTRALPQHLVRFHGDDRAEGKDKRVHIFHVKVVRCHGIGYRIVGEPL